MQSLSREERERRIQELLGRAGDKKQDLEAMVRVEQLRLEAESRPQEEEPPAPEIDMPSFSYNGNSGPAGSRYSSGPRREEPERYVKIADERSQFDEIDNLRISRFEESERGRKSQFDEIVRNQTRAHARDNQVEENQSSKYDSW